MKLRVRHNSIRLRLTQGEVSHFKEHGLLEETLVFSTEAANLLKYRLMANDVEKITAKYEDGLITITIPSPDARSWTTTQLTGLEAEQPIGEGKSLRILIEKDFACLEHRDGEDESDAFPHPQQERLGIS